jgi:hypothetical protein
MDFLPGRRQLLLAGATSALALPAWPAWAQSSDDAIVPFTFRASDAVLADLKRRLDQARWPERESPSIEVLNCGHPASSASLRVSLF